MAGVQPPTTFILMRHCPTLANDDRPLIAQSIQTDLCMSRQRGFYHKCHRCVYRGKSADFTIEVAHSNGVAPPHGEFASEENIASSDRLNEVLIDRAQPVADQERENRSDESVSETLR